MARGRSRLRFSLIYIRRNNMEKGTLNGLVVGMVVGAAIGAGLGLLYAPQSGRKTRRDIQKQVEDIKEKAEDLGQNVKGRAEELSHTVKDRTGDFTHSLKKRAEDAGTAFTETAEKYRRKMMDSIT
ncbi:YtxH domain-containing protein [Dehalogenimonas alkenigignens]|jgi:gas vesicle protein|nr:YtxH domain-containing protein [Dehalogenimonas alkenigignens]